MTSAVSGWSVAQAFGERFGRSTPAAASRSGTRLLGAVRSQSVDEAHLAFRALEALVTSQPAALPELVPAMAELLATDEETDLPWQVAWFLRNLRVERGFDLAPVYERFLGLLHSPGRDAALAAPHRRFAADEPVYVFGADDRLCLPEN